MKVKNMRPPLKIALKLGITINLTTFSWKVTGSNKNR